MKQTHVSIPELALVAGTRGALGLGVGLLLAHRISDAQRRPLGWALVAIGVLSTIPLAFEIFGRERVREG